MVDFIRVLGRIDSGEAASILEVVLGYRFSYLHFEGLGRMSMDLLPWVIRAILIVVGIILAIDESVAS
ncbi:hypothetical protein ACFLYR_08145 [Chloroflexota bacterium]